MCLHTILLDPIDPLRMFVAISAAGAFRTTDGGTTWQPINHGLQSEGIPDAEAEVGHCVHNLAMHPARPDTLFMQKHWDVMRTDDAGNSWREISGDFRPTSGSRSMFMRTSRRRSTSFRSPATPNTSRRKESCGSIAAAAVETNGSH